MDNISTLTDTKVNPATAQVLSVIVKDPSLFKSVMGVFPTMDELRELYDSHLSTFNEAQSEDPEKVREHQAKRQMLNRKFAAFHTAVKLAAAEQPHLLTAFGLPHPKPRKASTSLNKTERLKASHGDISGEIFLKATPIKNARSYDIGYCEGDPSVEESWKHHSVVAKASKMKVGGLTPGRVYWFRVRGIGASGPGPWSQYASLMAI